MSRDPAPREWVESGDTQHWDSAQLVSPHYALISKLKCRSNAHGTHSLHHWPVDQMSPRMVLGTALNAGHSSPADSKLSQS